MIVIALIIVAVYSVMAFVTMLMSARLEYASNPQEAFWMGVFFPFVLAVMVLTFLVNEIIIPVWDWCFAMPVQRMFDWARRSCSKCDAANGKHHKWCDLFEDTKKE